MSTRRESFYYSMLEEMSPKYPQCERSTIQIAVDLVSTCDTLQQIVTRDFSSYGLSKSTYNILILLQHGPPEGMQLHDLGELLLVSRANITGLIDHLEQKGLVTRTVDLTDRRARFAKITASAEELLEKVVPAHYRNLDALFKEVTVDERALLLPLLKKIRESLAAGRTVREPETNGKDSTCKNKFE